MKRPLKFCFTLPALAFGLAPQALFACSTCFGKSDSKMAEGMNAGIFTLLVVVVTVLAGIAAFCANAVVVAPRAATAVDGFIANFSDRAA